MSKDDNDAKQSLSRKVEGPGFAAIAGMDELKQQMTADIEIAKKW